MYPHSEYFYSQFRLQRERVGMSCFHSLNLMGSQELAAPQVGEDMCLAHLALVQGKLFPKCFSKVADPSMADSPRNWQKRLSPSLCHQRTMSSRMPFPSSLAWWPVEPAAIQGSGAHMWLQMWAGHWSAEGLWLVTGIDA